MDETDGLEHGDDAGEILASDQDINVLGVPHGLLIDASDPRGDGIAADDNIGNARLLQGRSRATGPLSDSFHGGAHPFPGEVLEYNDSHTRFPKAYSLTPSLSVAFLSGINKRMREAWVRSSGFSRLFSA
jgi:hypothetical protein